MLANIDVWQGAHMSSGVSHPVFRTSDPVAALAAARQLLALGDRDYAQVSVDVELCTVAEVWELRRLLPDAWFRTENEEFWAREFDAKAGLRCDWQAAELSEDADGLVDLLPLWASLLDQPVGSVEDAFTALVGPRYGSIRWDQVIWPAVDERGYNGRVEHDGVTLVFNCEDPGTDWQIGTHTVCVNVQKTGDSQSYAAWLAEQIGQAVIGPPYN
ncbi:MULTISPECIES: hypothetical protein [unclassified Streptomyces]|uniref:hypothetical protein n=1 Tax=unclassified Streptomyces TaxID=2593676 RepID=UPI0035DA9ABB